MALEKTTEWAIIVAAVAGIATIMVVAGLFSATQTINSTGTVNTVGVAVYWNSGCTNATTAINWGSISPGENRSYTIYIKNPGNTAGVLGMATSGWNPLNCTSYISVGWNCTGYRLEAGSVVPANVTLSVSSSVSGITSFSFNMTITGTA